MVRFLEERFIFGVKIVISFVLKPCCHVMDSIKRVKITHKCRKISEIAPKRCLWPEISNWSGFWDEKLIVGIVIVISLILSSFHDVKDPIERLKITYKYRKFSEVASKSCLTKNKEIGRKMHCWYQNCYIISFGSVLWRHIPIKESKYPINKEKFRNYIEMEGVYDGLWFMMVYEDFGSNNPLLVSKLS